MKCRFPTLFLLLVIVGATASNIQASGSFVPSSSGPGSAGYNAGKALFYGRKGDVNCVSCHKSFKRSQLKTLTTTVSQQVINCELHTPCFSESLKDKQLKALDAYFSKRYRLK